jgi:hypothetical protein
MPTTTAAPVTAVAAAMTSTAPVSATMTSAAPVSATMTSAAATTALAAAASNRDYFALGFDEIRIQAGPQHGHGCLNRV